MVLRADGQTNVIAVSEHLSCPSVGSRLPDQGRACRLSISTPVNATSVPASFEILADGRESFAASSKFTRLPSRANVVCAAVPESALYRRRIQQLQSWRTKRIARTGRGKRRRRILEDRIPRLLRTMRQEDWQSRARALKMYAQLLPLFGLHTDNTRSRKSGSTSRSSTASPKKRPRSSSLSSAPQVSARPH